MNLRSYEDPMYLWEAVQVGNQLPVTNVDDDELVCVHVRDIEPAIHRIEALIIEPDCRPRQRYIGHDG